MDNTSVRVGLISECGSFLGTTSQGTYRLGGATSVVLDLNHSLAIGGGLTAMIRLAGLK
jgi:hypothetical protein